MVLPPVTVTCSVRSAALARDSPRRMLRAIRIVNVLAVEADAWALALPIATLRPPERIPSRRAPEPPTIRRPGDGQAGEENPASLRPRLAIRAELSSGRSAIARASETEPAVV